MKNLSQSRIAVTAAAMLLFGLGAMVGHRPASAQPNRPASPVELVSPVPLPVSGEVTVSGSVTVANSPTVQAAQSGVWSVRNLDERGRTPYQAYESSTFSSCGTFHCTLVFPAVPAGKRLVIEHASGGVNIAPGTVITGVILSTAFGERLVSIPTVFQGTATTSLGTQDWHQFGATVVAYAEPGVAPEIVVSVAPAQSGSTFASANISGYLVDIP